MTREEKEQAGKYVLQMARLLEDGCYQQEMLLKAVHIIDEALEQEPTTKNDLGVDLISRADVLKLMQDNWHTHNGDWAMQESMDDIRALPSATPQEPRKGHWIKYDKEYFTPERLTSVIHSIRECSECHTRIADFCGEMKFCPNCGADMRGEET